ncbi:propanediol dehydratase small subunit [Amycolatopsis endophytica]|uniref:Propanediol dehydratase small subunit n=1 Tax=Amycolatopsis endophytica TaxID=860233 RepID=A0A853B3S1_9PSEU|nr:diol dehydratase small subunit [Amycolatopsis endophytica]NYI89475.1 propanediol dehydratase small subunit [Amycolatopsis endophytica]
MTTPSQVDLDPGRDYPLAARRPELLKTPTGKRLDDLTMEAVLAGDVAAEDLRIAPETLRLQAQIADRMGRPQLAQNFRRAAELTALPDELVLSFYNALRPRASTKQQLTAIADELESKYSATLCAALVREAADVYERRDILAPGKGTR